MKKAIMIGTFTFVFALLAACQENNDSGGDSYAFEDCISAKVTGEDRASLRVLMRWIVGEYRDSDGRKNVIICDPADEWDVPPKYQYMDTFWSIPLRIGVAGVSKTISGHVDLDALPNKDQVLVNTIFLFYQINDQAYEAHNEFVDEQTMKWIFTYPDEGMVWTKTEP